MLKNMKSKIHAFVLLRINNTHTRNDVVSKKCSDEFIEQVMLFDGLYEALWQALHAPIQHINIYLNVFYDIDARIRHINFAPSLQELWNTFSYEFEKWDISTISVNCSKIIDFISSSGIKRDDRVYLEIDESTRKMYDISPSSTNVTFGEVVYVLYPCWMMSDVVIEKGVAVMSKTI